MTVVRGVCKQCVRLINTIEGWLPWLKRLYFAICLFANEKWCCAHLMGTWINEGANKLEELACNSNWNVAADCCAFMYMFNHFHVLRCIEYDWVAREIDRKVPLLAVTIRSFFCCRRVFARGKGIADNHLFKAYCTSWDSAHFAWVLTCFSTNSEEDSMSCHILTTTQREKCKTAAKYSNN